jgi:uncharacterized protein YjbI with pentapeptide repeats
VKLTETKLHKILRQHSAWLDKKPTGKRAELGCANLRGADLSGANLSGANLSGASLNGADLNDADLRGASLSKADLRDADLRGASLNCADLNDADLRGASLGKAGLGGASLNGADLRGANLRGAELGEANLSGADLGEASLRKADLRDADLGEANLRGADLGEANLSGAKNVPDLAAAQTLITPAGTIEGWKKCRHGVVVRLLIPAEARRSNATGRKCRAEYADVIEVIGATTAASLRTPETTYTAGRRVFCHQWCEDRWIECGGGIHFYLTRSEAESHQ